MSETLRVVTTEDGEFYVKPEPRDRRCHACAGEPDGTTATCRRLNEAAGGEDYCFHNRVIFVRKAAPAVKAAGSKDMEVYAAIAAGYPHTQSAGGLKLDSGKPRMELLDPLWLAEVAKVLGFGAQKYAAHNWRGGIVQSRLIGAALRHLLAHNSGEDTDPESGLPHLAHASCCLMFLTNLAATRPDLDDRFKGGRGMTTSAIVLATALKGADNGHVEIAQLTLDSVTQVQ